MAIIKRLALEPRIHQSTDITSPLPGSKNTQLFRKHSISFNTACIEVGIIVLKRPI